MAAAVNESEVVFELPAENPRKRANPLSVLFFRYESTIISLISVEIMHS